MQTFFIVGVQRSGTTLLSVMLGNHPEILLERRSLAFRIITGFKNLYDLTPHHLDVAPEAFMKWLIENDEGGRLAELIDHENIHQYKTVRELIQQSVNKKLVAEGKQIWGDKSPNLQHYLSDLLLLIPDAKIIHIVRDGRANAYSMAKRTPRHLLLSAQQWVDGNVFGIVNQQLLGEEQYHLIHYEKLLESPEEELRKVCDFLNISWHKAVLSTVDADLPEDKRYVKNFLDKGKMDTWKDKLSEKEIRKIEEIQGPLLRRLEYTTETDSLRVRPLSLRRRIAYNQWDNVKMLFRSKKTAMINKEMVKVPISLKNRVYKFFGNFTRDFLSFPIFKSVFWRGFYRKKRM